MSRIVHFNFSTRYRSENWLVIIGTLFSFINLILIAFLQKKKYEHAGLEPQRLISQEEADDAKRAKEAQINRSIMKLASVNLCLLVFVLSFISCKKKGQTESEIGPESEKVCAIVQVYTEFVGYIPRSSGSITNDFTYNSDGTVNEHKITHEASYTGDYIINYSYSKNKITELKTYIPNGLKERTVFSIDAEGRIIRAEVDPDVRPGGETIIFSYDALGYLVRIATSYHHTDEAPYDVYEDFFYMDGNLTSVKHSSKNATRETSPEESVTITYNNLPNTNNFYDIPAQEFVITSGILRKYFGKPSKNLIQKVTFGGANNIQELSYTYEIDNLGKPISAKRRMKRLGLDQWEHEIKFQYSCPL